MGRLCPECGLYVPQVQVITADLGPANKASDVIAVKLGCGHIVGEAEYAEFKARAAAINAKLSEDRRKLEQKAKADILAEYQKLRASKEAK